MTDLEIAKKYGQKYQTVVHGTRKHRSSCRHGGGTKIIIQLTLSKSWQFTRTAFRCQR